MRTRIAYHLLLAMTSAHCGGAQRPPDTPARSPSAACDTTTQCLAQIEAGADIELAQSGLRAVVLRQRTRAIPELLDGIEKTNATVSGSAMSSLKVLGREAEQFLETFPDPRAIRALAHFIVWGPHSAEAAEAVLKRRDEATGVVVSALRSSSNLTSTNHGLALTRIIGGDSDSLLKALLDSFKLAQAHDWTQARNCATALGFVGRAEALDPLVGALESKDWRLVLASIEAISRIGAAHSSGRDKISALARSHWSTQVRIESAAALQVIGTVDARAVHVELMRELQAGKTLSEFLNARGGDTWPLIRKKPTRPSTIGPWPFPTRAMPSPFPYWHGPLECRDRPHRSASRVEYKGQAIKLKQVEDIPQSVVWKNQKFEVDWMGRFFRQQADHRVQVGRSQDFLGFVTAFDSLFLVSGNASLHQGRVYRVLRDDGAVLVPFVELPGDPSWLEVLPDAILVGATSGAVAIDRNASIEALSCPARLP